MEKNKKDIELRSEKVRNIVGQVPPVLLRSGIMIISLVVILVLAGAYFMPYSETLSLQVRLYSDPAAEMVRAPQKGIVRMKSLPRHVEKDQWLGFLETGNNTFMELYSSTKGVLVSNCRNGFSVGRNDVLFAVIPDTIRSLYGLGYIDSGAKNRVETGQKINLELPEYPSGTYGSIEGRISEVYPLPLTDSLTNRVRYKVEIVFPHDLRTSYGNNLPYLPVTTGKATIILSDRPVLKRLLDLILR